MIRPYHPTDIEQLLKIFELNTPKYFDVKEIKDFEDYLPKYGDTYYTVLHDNNIVGGAGYFIKESDRSGHITWIFFDPNYAGLGFGKKTMDHCLAILKEDPRIEKLVIRTSQLAYGFFEKFGYVLMRTEKDYWGIGLDLYLMERSLEDEDVNK